MQEKSFFKDIKKYIYCQGEGDHVVNFKYTISLRLSGYCRFPMRKRITAY